MLAHRDRDRAELLGRRAELVHVAARDQRVPLRRRGQPVGQVVVARDARRRGSTTRPSATVSRARAARVAVPARRDAARSSATPDADRHRRVRSDATGAAPPMCTVAAKRRFSSPRFAASSSALREVREGHDAVDLLSRRAPRPRSRATAASSWRPSVRLAPQPWSRAYARLADPDDAGRSVLHDACQLARSRIRRRLTSLRSRRAWSARCSVSLARLSPRIFARISSVISRVAPLLAAARSGSRDCGCSRRPCAMSSKARSRPITILSSARPTAAPRRSCGSPCTARARTSR